MNTARGIFFWASDGPRAKHDRYNLQNLPRRSDFISNRLGARAFTRGDGGWPRQRIRRARDAVRRRHLGPAARAGAAVLARS